MILSPMFLAPSDAQVPVTGHGASGGCGCVCVVAPRHCLPVRGADAPCCHGPSHRQHPPAWSDGHDADSSLIASPDDCPCHDATPSLGASPCLDASLSLDLMHRRRGLERFGPGDWAADPDLGAGHGDGHHVDRDGPILWDYVSSVPDQATCNTTN